MKLSVAILTLLFIACSGCGTPPYHDISLGEISIATYGIPVYGTESVPFEYQEIALIAAGNVRAIVKKAREKYAADAIINLQSAPGVPDGSVLAGFGMVDGAFGFEGVAVRILNKDKTAVGVKPATEPPSPAAGTTD